MVEGYRVVDAHCHIYPEKIAAAASSNTNKFYDVEYSPYTGTVPELLALRAESGIDRFVVQSVATVPKQVRSINAFIASVVAEHGGCMTGLGTLHPDSADIRGDIEQIRELGLHGVKLHPDIQGFYIDERKCERIYDLCEEYSLPILMHTGDVRLQGSDCNRLIPVMKYHPELTVVSAHLGGWKQRDTPNLSLLELPKLYFDCSSCFYWSSICTVRDIIRAYGANRVLFGTDFPMWSYKTELPIVLSMGFSKQENRLLLAENAEKVFAISAAEG